MSLDLAVGKSSRSVGRWDTGEEVAAKALAGGKLTWEPVSKGGSYALGTRVGRKSAKRLAPKMLVSMGLETLAACSN